MSRFHFPLRRARAGSPLLALFLAGCATGGPASGVEPVAGTTVEGPLAPTLPPDIHWVRNSAEHDALFHQVYDLAAERLRELTPGREPGSWGVILDADETVLDNSDYQLRLAEAGASFSTETWQTWVREEAAGAKPGAKAFVDAVRRLGGRAAIVTNRDEVVCDPTRRNLAALEIEVDIVLCQQPGESGKEARFRRVQEGEAGDLPPLDVLLWIGDDVHDFPGLDQEMRDGVAEDFGAFGESFFIVPNPMYGSWEDNPVG